MGISKYFLGDHGALRKWIEYSQNRYLWFLITLLNPKEKELTLDDGCGNGRFSAAIAEKGSDVIALDLSKSLLKVAADQTRRSNGKIVPVLGDIQNLPFRNSVFDKVLCVNNLWVVPNYRMAMQEMFRASKDDGEVLIDHLNLLNWRILLSQFVYILNRFSGRHPMPLFYRTPYQIFAPFQGFRSETYTVSYSHARAIISKGKKILAERIIIKSIKSSSKEPPKARQKP